MTYKLDNGLYVHRKYFENLTGDTGQVGMFWILAKSRPDVAKVTAEIERRLDNAPVPIRAMSEKQWQLMFMEMLGNVQALLGGIGLATAFTLFLITSNTLAMAARERRGEAALLRILGIPPQDRAATPRPRGGVLRGGGSGPRRGLHGPVRPSRRKGAPRHAVCGNRALLRVDARSSPSSRDSPPRRRPSSLVPAINLSRRPVVSLAREAG